MKDKEEDTPSFGGEYNFCWFTSDDEPSKLANSVVPIIRETHLSRNRQHVVMETYRLSQIDNDVSPDISYSGDPGATSSMHRDDKFIIIADNKALTDKRTYDFLRFRNGENQIFTSGPKLVPEWQNRDTRNEPSEIYEWYQFHDHEIEYINAMNFYNLKLQRLSFNETIY